MDTAPGNDFSKTNCGLGKIFFLILAKEAILKNIQRVSMKSVHKQFNTDCNHQLTVKKIKGRQWCV